MIRPQFSYGCIAVQDFENLLMEFLLPFVSVVLLSETQTKLTINKKRDQGLLIGKNSLFVIICKLTNTHNKKWH